MLKKILAVAVIGIALNFGGTAEAYDNYVGTSNATGWECYVMTETVERSNDTTFVTLKMVDRYNDNLQYTHYLDYRFWYDSRNDVMRFSNDQGFSGIANKYETPIEWEMLQVIRKF